jgi:hypothetical protein
MTLETEKPIVEFEKDGDAVQSKKDMILSLFNSGTTDIESISVLTGAKPKEGLIDNYFDLYTSTAHPMNIYSKYFRGKLGFKDAATCEASVKTLEQAYRYFSNVQDRAGQHHALELALTMLNRARWTGKLEEAEIYRRWLVGKLSQPFVKEDEKAQQPALKLVA